MPSNISQSGSGAGWGWVGPLVSGLAGAYGSSSAAGAASTGENNAIGTETQLQSTLGGIYGHELNTGNGAFDALNSTLGLNGAAPSYAGFENSPGYQFAVQQGQQAINRQAAATGGAYSTSTLGAIGGYTAGMASENYNNYVNQLLQSAGIGASGNASFAGNMTSAANNIAQAQIGKGVAQANGVSGTAGAIGTAAQGMPWGSIISGIGSLFNNSGYSGSSENGIPPDQSTVYNSLGGANPFAGTDGGAPITPIDPSQFTDPYGGNIDTSSLYDPNSLGFQ